MNTLSEFDSEFPSGSCPCGCRGNRELHEAFESGLTGEVSRQRRFPRRPPPRAGAARPATPRPRPRPGRRGPGRVYVREPYPVAYPFEPEPGPGPSEEPGSESNRWVQDCLNRVFGLSLSTTGVLDAASRSAIRRLQKQESLPITGIASPGTEQALRRLCGEGDAPADPEWEGEWGESEWEWEGEVNRNSRDYIRWVQASLNKILGTRLTVDGVMGAQTRSAIRSFQKRQRLKVDGIVGPQTERALVAAGAGSPGGATAFSSTPTLIRKDCEVLDQFEFKKTSLRPFHTPEIISIARRILASQRGAKPIRSIRVVGHTDSEGSDAVNLDFGRRRAQQVASALSATLRRMRRDLAGRITILPPESRGEAQPVANNVTPRARASNRRVEIFFDSTSSPCTGCSFRHFFVEYDLRAGPDTPVNPNMTPDQRRARVSDVNDMVNELLPRLEARRAAALRRATPPSNPVSGPLLDVATRLSDTQLALYRQCFPDGRGGINFDDFQRCFEQFANGELRGPDPAKGDQGGPNGGFFFLFAEFAFLCIDSGVDASTWTRALEVFVKTQEIFMHVFRPRPHSTPPAVTAPLPAPCGTPPRRPLHSTTPGAGDGFEDINFNRVGQSDEARKAALRAKYAPMRSDVGRLAGAASENLLRAQCMP